MSIRLTRLYVLLAISMFCALPFFLGTQPRELNGATEVFNSGEGDPTKQLALLVLYGASFLILRPSRQLLFIGMPLLVLLLWCCASILWSVNPEGSERRLVALAGTVMISACAGIKLDLPTMARTIIQAAAFALFASLVVAVVDPGAGLDPEGRLRGVFVHKNQLSAFAVVALFTVFFRLLESPPALPRLGLGILFVLCMVCLVISRSAGPFPAMFFAVAVLSICYSVQVGHGRFKAMLPIAIAAGVVLAGMVLTTEGLGLFGRGDDFSGRVPIWQFAMTMIEQRLLVGYGYGVFWLGDNAPAAPFWRATYNFAPHAHNGFIELALDAGMVGLVLYGAAIVLLATRLFGLIKARWGGLYPFWAMAIAAFLLVVNLGEAGGWVGNDLPTLLLVYLIVRTNVEHARLRAEQRRVPGALAVQGSLHPAPIYQV
jgi:exopolysaccharide production protein ExoQ